MSSEQENVKHRPTCLQLAFHAQSTYCIVGLAITEDKAVVDGNCKIWECIPNSHENGIVSQHSPTVHCDWDEVALTKSQRNITGINCVCSLSLSLPSFLPSSLPLSLSLWTKSERLSTSNTFIVKQARIRRGNQIGFWVRPLNLGQGPQVAFVFFCARLFLHYEENLMIRGSFYNFLIPLCHYLCEYSSVRPPSPHPHPFLCWKSPGHNRDPLSGPSIFSAARNRNAALLVQCLVWPSCWTLLDLEIPQRTSLAGCVSQF